MRLSPFALIDRWRAPPPLSARAGWIVGAVFAHRGMHGPGVPENSPSAFAAAIERGFGIECNVQRTAEDEPVVFHDWELDRLTDDSGPVAARPASSLRAVGLSGSGDQIPSLLDLLGQIDGLVPLLIEVKSREDLPVADFCASVRKAIDGYGGDHAVMSFDPRVPRWFADHSPETERGLVVTEEGARGIAGRAGRAGRIRRRLAFWQARPDFLAYDIRDLPSHFASGQRARGLPLATWTVRSPELRARAARHADAPIAEAQGLDAAV